LPVGLAFALAQTTLIPAIPDLARSLHTSAGNVAWGRLWRSRCRRCRRR